MTKFNAGRRVLALAGAVAALSVGASANAAVTFSTGPLLASPTLFNGFEGLNADGGGFFGPYSEGGITAQYSDPGHDVWSASQAYEGVRSWYPDGGDAGAYTIITRTGGGEMSAMTLAIGSGFFGCCGTFFYTVLDKGVIVGSGSGPTIPTYQAGWVTGGFSGGNFDEVDLSVSIGGEDAGAYDAIGVNTAGVPEPATWAMSIVGFGLLGSAIRRRKASLAV